MIFAIIGLGCILIFGGLIYTVFLTIWNDLYVMMFSSLLLSAQGSTSLLVLNAFWQSLPAVIMIVGVIWFIRTLIDRSTRGSG